jgi:hypothetical protein
MMRQAFGLLLEMRAHQNGNQLLAQAIAFLEVLSRDKEAKVSPVMFSVHLLELRRS